MNTPPPSHLHADARPLAWELLHAADPRALLEALGDAERTTAVWVDAALAHAQARAALLRAALALRQREYVAARSQLDRFDAAAPQDRSAALDGERALLAAELWMQAGQFEAAHQALASVPAPAALAGLRLKFVQPWVLAQLLLLEGRHLEAEQSWSASASLALAAGDAAFAARARLERARCARARGLRDLWRGDNTAAVQAWQAVEQACSEALGADSGPRAQLPRELWLLHAQALLRLQLPQAAEQALAAFAAYSGLAAGDEICTIEADALRAELLALHGQRAEAATLLQATARRAQQLADPDLRERLLEVAVELAGQQAEPDEQAQLLRSQRKLREDALRAEAERQAEVSALLLQTERKLREAAEARVRALSLEAANQALRNQTVALSAAAQTDPLTGLANRRGFDPVYAQRHARARAAGEPLPLALVDLDHFKRINDTHGHPAGDAVLCQLGTLLHQACRAGDLVARLGGEEFAIVFERSTLAQAREACERLRLLVQTQGGAMLPPDAVVTASFGLCDSATWADPGSGLQAADEALYAAKHGGRNRLCTHSADREANPPHSPDS